MPSRFKQVVPDLLYRGGVPKPWEVNILKLEFGIQQIISLDQDAADKIHDECKKLNINHIVIPLHSFENFDKQAELLIQPNGVSRLINNKPTFVHCHHGKDRTGMFVGKYRTENGWDCKAALDEAISFGFGTGLDPEVIRKYISVIVSGCKTNHEHVGLKYYFDKLMKRSCLCSDCGMVKSASSFCPHCIITNALLTNVAILGVKIDPPEDKDKPKSPSNIDAAEEAREQPNAIKLHDDEPIAGGSDMVDFAPPGSLVMGKNIRMKLLKQLIKSSSEQKVSFKIPEEEKQLASKCIESLRVLVDKILFKVYTNEKYVDILDVMYNPLKENEGITVEQTKKIVPHLTVYIDILDKNMISVKEYASGCLDILRKFDSDFEVASMVKSLFDMVDNLDDEKDTFVEVLENVDDNDFQKNVLETIKTLKKSAAQFEQLINERIIPYLRKDILNEDWSSEIKKDIKRDKKEQKEGA